MNKSQSGFTLVELVVVILVLGILSATALPRFMNVNQQAHDAAVAGVGGSFGAGIALAKAQWIANGSTSAVGAVSNFGEGNVSVNVSGWAIDTSTSGAAAPGDACVAVWNSIMQNPPSVSTGTGNDYQVIASSGFGDNLGCTYEYQAETNQAILYDAGNGAVTISQ